METNYLFIYGYQFLLLFVYCTFYKRPSTYIMKVVLTALFLLSCGVLSSNVYVNVVGFFLFLSVLVTTGVKDVVTKTTAFKLNFAFVLLLIGTILCTINQLINSVFVFSLTASLLVIFISIVVVTVFFNTANYNINAIHVYDVEICNFSNGDVNEDETLKNTLASIHIWFGQSKCYLNPDYTLNQLQNDIDIDRKLISKAINRIEGVNFYQFLAMFRINYAKTMLKKNDVYTLETLSNECGFYSKSSFNKYFKLFEGETPSRFKIKQT